MTEAGTSLRTCSIEQRSFQSQPPGRPVSLTGPSQDRTRSFGGNTNCFNSSILVLICCHNRLPMSCRSDEEDDAALPPPGFSTPTKPKGNDGAGHVSPDAGRMETDSDPDVEKQFEESTGKKRCYAGPLVYRVVKEWTTCPQAELEDREIEHQIYTEMKEYMHASGLKKTPGHRPKETDIHLWKQYTKAYYNKRTNEWVRSFRCPMHCRFFCDAPVRLNTGYNYKRLEFAKTHDLQSHVNERSKSLSHDQIVLIHDAVVIAPNQSGTKLRRNLCQT